jgi:hypothetical protein
MKLHRILVAACALAAAAATPHALRAQSDIRFSGAAAMAVPVGDLGNAADVGLSLMFRGERPISNSNWSVRGDLSWDRFAGRLGNVNSYSYLGAAANMVHRSRDSRVYEFGGVGVYGGRTAFNDDLNSDNANVGAQMGLGVDLNPGPHTPFVEFGVTSVATSNSTSRVWFPVRFGVRF